MHWAQIHCVPATAALCQVPRGFAQFMLRSVLPHLHSYHYHFATMPSFVWVDVTFRMKQKKKTNLTKSLFLLILLEPYHILSCLCLAFMVASISSKEITSKISLVLVSLYFITSTQCIPFTITTPITFVMAVLHICYDTCKGRCKQLMF